MMNIGDGTTDFPPGMIGVVHRTIGLQAGWNSLITLHKPALTGITTMSGTAISEQRNEIAKIFMQRPEYKWLLWIDDDQVYPPDALMRALAREKPIVGAVISQKYPPFSPQFFFHDGAGEGAFSEKTKLRRATNTECVGNDVIQVGATGCGFLLIQRKVMEDVKFPWYASRWDGVGEDVYFCLKAQDAGHTVWIDKSLKIGHLTVVSVVLGENGEPVFTQDKFVPSKIISH